MARRPDDVSARDRQLRRGAWATSIVVVGLLLFTWPFLRVPLLGIGRSYAHLIGSWAVVVAALALLARALARRGSSGDDRA
jgi:hypothetical protein